MKGISCILLALLLSSCAAIHHTSNKKLSNTESGNIETARQLVEIIFDKDTIYQQIIDFGEISVKDRFDRNPKTKEYSEVLTDVTLEVLGEYFNDPSTQTKIKNAYALIYAEEFSEKELNDLISFNKTATARKARAKLPIIMERVRQESELLIGLTVPKYEQMLINKLKKLQEEGLLPRT